MKPGAENCFRSPPWVPRAQILGPSFAALPGATVCESSQSPQGMPELVHRHVDPPAKDFLFNISCCVFVCLFVRPVQATWLPWGRGRPSGPPCSEAFQSSLGITSEGLPITSQWNAYVCRGLPANWFGGKNKSGRSGSDSRFCGGNVGTPVEPQSPLACPRTGFISFSGLLLPSDLWDTVNRSGRRRQHCLLAGSSRKTNFYCNDAVSTFF